MRELILIIIVVVLLVVYGYTLYLIGWNDGFDDGALFEKDRHQTPYLNDLIDEEEA